MQALQAYPVAAQAMCSHALLELVNCDAVYLTDMVQRMITERSLDVLALMET